jgi:nucleoside-diphosphate-sugar epimerase
VLKVVILGANGFIGSALTAASLRGRPWEVFAMDLADNRLAELSSNPRFHFVEGGLRYQPGVDRVSREEVRRDRSPGCHRQPGSVRYRPLRVFEPDFEANLVIVWLCVRYRKHGLPMRLVDGGEQKRSFTYIDDAIDCILRIIENPNQVVTRGRAPGSSPRSRGHSGLENQHLKPDSRRLF